jgi:hypothetical protein
MLNLVELNLESLSLLEEEFLQKRIEKPKEISQKSQVSGKLRRRLGLLMQRKKDKSLKKKERSSRGTKDPHLEHNQK